MRNGIKLRLSIARQVSPAREVLAEQADAPRQRLHHVPRLLTAETNQQDVARGPLPQRRDLGMGPAHEQVAFPMPGDRAVLDRGGAFPNRDRVDDPASRVRCGVLRAPIRPALAQVAIKAFFSTPRLWTKRLR